MGMDRATLSIDSLPVVASGVVAKLDDIVAQAKKAQQERARSYREQALKILPWICGRCAREFGRERLRELTVHHKDGNHDNNPPDGSNWELLCLYCHDNEHQKQVELAQRGAGKPQTAKIATGNPFADLKDLLARKDDK